MRSTGAIACIATASRAPATARRPRSSIRCPAIIARGSSSSPRPPPASRPIATTCAGRSPTACTGPRCRRSSPPDRGRDRAGDRLRDLPQHAGRDRAGLDRGGGDLGREGPERPRPTTSSRRSPTASSTSGSRRRRQVVNPPIPRTPSSRESILRGRDLFLGEPTRSCNATATAGWPWATARAS